MDLDWYYKAAILIGCLILSAFFSGSEVSLFSLDKSKIQELKKTNQVLGIYISTLLESPGRLLITILICNTLVNVAAAFISVTIVIDLAKSYGMNTNLLILFQIIILTLLLLVTGKITPKLYASKNPVLFSKIAGAPLYWLSILLYPVSILLTDVFKVSILKSKTGKSRLSYSADLKELAGMGMENGVLEEEEHGLINGLMSFRTVTVREVMTPRVDIKAVSVDTDFNELMKIITESMHSRIPLYKENLDEIIGVIYAKDLLPYLNNEVKKKTLALAKITRPAMFVPETKLISDLMREFQEKKMHVGIVVDEYGGTAGLISLEDILEEIVGDIRDEYDNDENTITKLDSNSFLVLGKVTIDELNEVLKVDFTSENDGDYDTIGGFIFNYAGEIPVPGYNFEYKNYRFTVREVNKKRVQKVLIEPLSEIEHQENNQT